MRFFNKDRSKFIFCAGSILLGALLLYVGKLSGDQWIGMTEWIVSILVAGHVAQSHVDNLAAKVTETTTSGDITVSKTGTS